MTKIHSKYGSFDYNCGFEMNCKKKDCLNCRRKFELKKPLKLSHAEASVIEDFAMCDLKLTLEEKPEEIEFMQDIMRNLLKRLFRCEKEINNYKNYKYKPSKNMKKINKIINRMKERNGKI